MTNLILCAIAGSAAGWIGFSFMKLNAERGLATSILIGALGGFLGGYLFAPMLATGGGAANPGDFNPFPVFIALASAAAILIISSMIRKRFGL